MEALNPCQKEGKKLRKAVKDRHSEIVSIRLTQEERELLEVYASRENLKLTTVMRSCALDCAQRFLDDELLFSDVRPEDMGAAKAAVAGMIEDFKLVVCKTMDRMDERLMYLEAIAYENAYVSLFCTPYLDQEKSQEAIDRTNQHMEIFKKRVRSALVKKIGI